MAVTSFASGTQTATVGTEHTLASVNVAGVYQFWADLSGMLAGDVVELRVYRMVKSGGTSRVVAMAAFYGVQPTDDAVKRTDGQACPLAVTDGLKFTLKQTFGTSRTFDYGADQIA
jgi:hypothetical protein